MAPNITQGNMRVTLRVHVMTLLLTFKSLTGLIDGRGRGLQRCQGIPAWETLYVSRIGQDLPKSENLTLGAVKDFYGTPTFRVAETRPGRITLPFLQNKIGYSQFDV